MGPLPEDMEAVVVLSSDDDEDIQEFPPLKQSSRPEPNIMPVDTASAEQVVLSSDEDEDKLCRLEEEVETSLIELRQTDPFTTGSGKTPETMTQKQLKSFLSSYDGSLPRFQ